MWRVFFCILGLISFALTVGACDQEPPKLEEALRREADSVFNSQTSQIASEIDSLCSLHFDSLVQIQFDSIVEQRTEHIERLSKPR